MSPRSTLVLLAVPLLAASCGGGSKHASTGTTATGSTTTTSVQDFVAQGNQVCIRSDRRVYGIGRLSRNPVAWQKTADAGRVGLAEMRSVEPPAADAAQFKLLLDYAQQLVSAIQAVHDNLVAKKYQTAIQAQFRAALFQDKVHAAAKALGLTFCQQSLTNWPA